MFKYTVLTLIVNNYEPVREIPNPQDDVEYLLITDNRYLTSSTWNIIYEPEIDNNFLTPQEKIYFIKWKKLFDYCHSNIIFRIDGSVQITKSLDDIINHFENGNYDIAFMVHPVRDNLLEEYDAWKLYRNLDDYYKDNFINYCNSIGYDLDLPGLIETTVMIYKKNDKCQNLISDMYNTLKDYNGIKDKNDQCWFSTVLYKYINNLNYYSYCENLVNSDYLNWHFHGMTGNSYAGDESLMFIKENINPPTYNLFGNEIIGNYSIYDNELRIAVCAITKYENPYLVNWVKHYQSLGFTNIILYDNNIEKDEMAYNVLKEYQDNGFVKVIYYNTGEVNNQHAIEYDDCYKNYSNDYDWFFFCDVDEYLDITDGSKNISEFLNKYSDKDCIKVFWKIYDDNGLIDYSEESDFTKFTHQSDYQTCFSKPLIKSNLNIDWLNAVTQHLPLFNEDYKVYEMRGIYEDKNYGYITDYTNNSQFHESLCNSIFIHHFLCRTIYDYIAIKSKKFNTLCNFALNDNSWTLQCNSLKAFFTYNTFTLEKYNYALELAKTYRTDKYFLEDFNISDYTNKVAVCTIARKENKYIREFVEYYKNYGVDNILLYDNNYDGEEDFHDAINDYIESGFVKLHDKRNIKEKYQVGDILPDCVQCCVYQECLDEYKDKYDWIAFFDVDEYMYTEGFDNIKCFLNQDHFKEANHIFLQWKNMVSSNEHYNIYYEDKPLQERFDKIKYTTQETEHDIIIGQKMYDRFTENLAFKKNGVFKLYNDLIYKSIIHTSIKELPVEFISTPHIPNWKHENVKYCNSEGLYFPVRFESVMSRIQSEKCYLKHYSVKSLEEYISKFIPTGDSHCCFGTNNDPKKYLYYSLITYFNNNEMSKEKLLYLISIKDSLHDFLKNEIEYLEQKHKNLLMDKKPFLSVVIPSYNSRNTIERLLDSIKIQSFKDYEVLIINDRSNDNFQELVESYKQYMNVFIIDNKSDKHGPNIGRNLGIELAQGTLIEFIDADDELPFDDVFQTVYDAYIKNPNLVKIEGRNFSHTDKDYDMYYWYNIHGKFFKLEFIRKYNLIYDEDINYNEDIYYMGLINNYIDATNSEQLYIPRPLYRMISTIGSHTSNDPYFYERTFKTYIRGRYLPVLQAIAEFPEIRESRLPILYEVFGEAYFQYQGFLYRMWKEGNDMPDKTKEIIKTNRHELQHLLAMYKLVANLSKDDLINYYLNNIDRYEHMWDFSEAWIHYPFVIQESLIDCFSIYSNYEKITE